MGVIAFACPDEAGGLEKLFPKTKAGKASAKFALTISIIFPKAFKGNYPTDP